MGYSACPQVAREVKSWVYEVGSSDNQPCRSLVFAQDPLQCEFCKAAKPAYLVVEARISASFGQSPLQSPCEGVQETMASWCCCSGWLLVDTHEVQI